MSSRMSEHISITKFLRNFCSRWIQGNTGAARNFIVFDDSCKRHNCEQTDYVGFCWRMFQDGWTYLYHGIVINTRQIEANLRTARNLITLDCGCKRRRDIIFKMKVSLFSKYSKIGGHITITEFFRNVCFRQIEANTRTARNWIVSDCGCKRPRDVVFTTNFI